SLVSEDIVPIVLPHTNEQGGMIPVMCLSVSPAGNLIAAGCSDGAVRVWAYGDAEDDAAWGTGRHNTRRTGRDTIGQGEVFRSEAAAVSAASSSPSTAAVSASAGAPWSGDAAAAATVPSGLATLAVAAATAGGRIGGAAGVTVFAPGASSSGFPRSGAFAEGPGGFVGSAGAGEFPAPWEGVLGGGTAGTSGGGALGGQAPMIGSLESSTPSTPPVPSGSPGGARGERREGRGGRGGGRRGGLEVRLATKLFGHVSGVTDARFSGLGDRILTASMEDGTARIYSWGPRFSNVKHVVLKVCRQDTAAAGRARGGGRARGAGGAGKKSTLDDACWSCDDEIIVTTEKAPAPSAAASRALEDADTGSTFKV
ncbi:unnamed protein product, partial [Hapterophycus canaliculatus]